MGSQQIQKLETDVHIKASAEQFHDVFCNRTYHIGNICPEKVQSVDILEGQWGTEGSIIIWNFVHDGKTCVSKEVVESIDRKNNKMTFKVLEGDFKSFLFKLHVIPQKEGSLVRWTVEYEKLKDNFPEPHTMMHSLVDLTKDINAHLIIKN